MCELLRWDTTSKTKVRDTGDELPNDMVIIENITCIRILVG